MSKTKFSLLLFWITLSLLWASPIPAKEEATSTEVQVATRISSSTVTLSDTLTFSIKLVWEGEPNRFLIEELQPPGLENLRIVGTKTELNSFEKEGVIYTAKVYSLALAGDSAGPGRIEPLTVNYYDTRTDQALSFTSQPYQVEIRPAVRSGSSRFGWFLIAVAILLGFGYVLRGYHKIKKPVLKSDLTRTLEEQAREKIIRLKAEDAESFLIQTRKIVIEYLEQRLKQNLAGKTTAEIVESLNSISPEKEELVKEILEESDRAKFIPGSALAFSRGEIVGKLEKLWEPEAR